MADITLEPGVLPPPACYADEQARFNAYVASIIATVTGGLQWQASATAPVDETLFWLRLDGNGRPVEALQWSVADGAWVRWQSQVINTGVPGGAGNNYTLTNSPAMTAAVAYRIGSTFTFKANHANTGAATLNVDGLGARDIKKFGATSALAAGDIAVGQMVTVVYDGTQFQVVSVLTSTATNGSAVFTSAGAANWVVPAGVYSVVVEMVGGGGGGGYSASCRGGGGAGYSRKRWAVNPGDSIPYVVGAAGTAGSSFGSPNATSGGDSSFNTTQIAQGGVNGDLSGAGGSFSGSDYGFNGEAGTTTTAQDSPGKYKGGKPGGGWGYGGNWDGATASAGYVGGGGCGDNDSGGGAASSNGGVGMIVITW
jgi:hypothetical protein